MEITFEQTSQPVAAAPIVDKGGFYFAETSRLQKQLDDVDKCEDDRDDDVDRDAD